MRVLFIVLLISLATCARIRSLSPEKLQSELQKSNYGRALLHLVELHSMAGGAVSELLDAIEGLVDDLEDGLELLEFNF